MPTNIYPKQNSLVDKPFLSLAMLMCLFVFMLTVTALIVQFISAKMANQVAMLRIGAILQDILVFILPALATAMLSTRLPARLLAIEKFPPLPVVLVAIATMIFSIPAMNAVVEWNNSIELPESMAPIMEQMRAMEDAASQSIQKMIGGSGVGSLIMSILIIGIFAGFSEEIFFRGAMQRLLGCRLGVHAAVWTTAIVFSLVHLQFFGFVPRMILGAFFGYLLVWSGSLWLAVIAHAFNNSLVVVFQWLQNSGTISTDINKVGVESASGSNIVLCIASILLVVAGIYTLRKLTLSK